jgi:predicted nucleic acid-binding protein
VAGKGLGPHRRWVVDASVAVGWVHAGQATEQTQAMLEALFEGAEAFVPALWPVEVSNALLVLERRGKITAADRQTALEHLAALPIEIDHEMARLAFGEASALATAQKLTVYDALYLELAVRLEVALVCRDGALREAAKRLRVPVLP